jgi:5'-3' exonuclease
VRPVPSRGVDDVVYVLDSSWWIHRAFHIGGADGMVAHVVGWLVSLLIDRDPQYLVAAVESAGKTFRHLAFPDYKAHRAKKGDEFHAQAQRVLDILTAHRIPLLWAEGWEADDAIAAATRQARSQGMRVVIVTADKDLHQLVTDVEPYVAIWDGKSESMRDENDVIAKFGVEPRKLGDVLAIMGDASDNIPGVDGFGAEKAARVVKHFGSLAEALAVAPPSDVRLAEIDGAVKQVVKDIAKLKRAGHDYHGLEVVRDDAREELAMAKALVKIHEHAADVDLSRRLVTLDDAAPVEWDVDAASVGGYDVPKIKRIYQEFGFTRLAESVEPTAKRASMF